MTSSGTYAYNPIISDVGLDAFGRLQIRSASITAEHMISLRQAANSVLVRWANRGVNLWAVELSTVPLVQGVGTYDAPANTVMMLEAYVRNYAMGSSEDLTTDFDTTISDATVTIGYPSHGFEVGNWINIITPVAIGGLVISGFYQVASVIDDDTFTIEAASNATATASGGSLPVFDTTAASATVAVTLAAHGYSAGETFSVPVATAVGGLTLSGDYTIATIVGANSFTITAPNQASSTATATLNGGEVQIAGQSEGSQPTDRPVVAWSRTEYAAVGNKFVQGVPTTFYFNRAISPDFTVWPLPDANGPYEFRYYRMRQLQDANASGLETLDMPYRFIEAFTAALTAHLAITWRPESAEKLLAYANEVFEEAAHEDRQRVNLTIQPDLSGYFR